MKNENIAFLICIAAVICSFAGCTAIGSIADRHSAESICAGAWSPNAYCVELAKAKAKASRNWCAIKHRPGDSDGRLEWFPARLDGLCYAKDEPAFVARGPNGECRDRMNVTIPCPEVKP